MNGSEKQVSWAKEIIENRVALANAIAAKRGFAGYWNGYMAQYPEFNLPAVLEMLNSMDDAADVIKNKDVSLIKLYIKHTGWVAPETNDTDSDDPFAL